MAQAPRDNNGITTLIGTSSTDGSTPVAVYANPTDHTIVIDDNTTGSDLSGDNASRDQNYVPALLAVSEVDGVTPVPVYVNATTHALLVDST